MCSSKRCKYRNINYKTYINFWVSVLWLWVKMTRFMLTFHDTFEPLSNNSLLNVPPCACVCVRDNIILMKQINQSVPDIHREAVVSQSDPPLLQIDVEHRFVGDGQFALFLLSQDGHPARPQHGVLVPHQLHSGQIWWKGGSHRSKRWGVRECKTDREKRGKKYIKFILLQPSNPLQRKANI